MKITIRYVSTFEKEVFYGHEVIMGNEILRDMRKLGIPVVGRLGVIGVTHGELTYERRVNDRIWTWTGEKPAPIVATVEDDEL